ncbi:hypothetical protein GIB67_003166 [Kingdonia uniflora]|uniref:Carbohydrate kinase PfkB domain-containing protein n=1 Tax=Kingdonia uniflora TaxID=39325 RepID=A0A7J7N6G3_9MAGN|nr:hypothetical protein GIB67_003166 [Kingdonia uniflora]
MLVSISLQFQHSTALISEEYKDCHQVSDDEVAFLTHGDANDKNNVLPLWYDGLKLLVVTDGKKGCRYFTKVDFLQLKTVDTTGTGDAFVGDFFLPYQRMKLAPHTDMGVEHLQHALEISPRNVAAYFGLASKLLGLSKECVNNGAFSWGASLLKLGYVKCVPWTNEQWTSDTIEMAYITSIYSSKNKRLIRIFAKTESAIHAQSVTAQTSFNSLMPKISQLRESVKSKHLQLINFNKTTTTSTIIQSQMPHLDEWSALDVDYSTSLSGAITSLQAGSLRLPVNENVRVDIEELEGALNSASNVIETMSSHFQGFLPKAEEIVEAFASNRSPRYEPIVYIDKPLSISERIAFYSIAECVVVSAVRDAMNLTPYEYIVCRQGVSGLGLGSDFSGIKKNMLVMSEFVGCSPSLSGAIRINLWNIETIGEALNEAILMEESKKQLLHEKYYRYVSTHDVSYWSRSFMQDLERSCKDHFRRRCYAMGIGFGFRLVALDANFKKLEISTIESAYKKSRNRAILLDYDGTVMPQTTINKTPSDEDCEGNLDHLESVLANEVVAVKRGQFIIEVKPQGVSKGIVADKVFTSITNDERKADFVLCIGDDRLDEEMFEIIEKAMSRIASPQYFSFCLHSWTKTSKAKYYLDDIAEVINMLEAFAEISDPCPLPDEKPKNSL